MVGILKGEHLLEECMCTTICLLFLPGDKFLLAAEGYIFSLTVVSKWDKLEESGP